MCEYCGFGSIGHSNVILVGDFNMDSSDESTYTHSVYLSFHYFDNFLLRF